MKFYLVNENYLDFLRMSENKNILNSFLWIKLKIIGSYFLLKKMFLFKK